VSSCDQLNFSAPLSSSRRTTMFGFAVVCGIGPADWGVVDGLRGCIGAGTRSALGEWVTNAVPQSDISVSGGLRTSSAGAARSREQSTRIEDEGQGSSRPRWLVTAVLSL
jgi:hypothetical protein